MSLSGSSPYLPANAHFAWSATPLAHTRLDWLRAVVLVGGLTGVGVLFSRATSSVLYSYTFTFRVACLYAPTAFVLILFLGYARFPLAAALFYGFLPISQAAHGSDYLLGDWDAGLTFDMLLAPALIIIGFVGPSAGTQVASRPLPSSLRALFGAILIAAVISTVLAGAPDVAAVNLLARFALPILVTLACYRRFRSIEEYRTAWFGFVTGLLLICVYQYQRGVLNELQFAEEVSQRYLGASQSFAIPMLPLIGAQIGRAHV